MSGGAESTRTPHSVDDLARLYPGPGHHAQPRFHPLPNKPPGGVSRAARRLGPVPLSRVPTRPAPSEAAGAAPRSWSRCWPRPPMRTTSWREAFPLRAACPNCRPCPALQARPSDAPTRHRVLRPPSGHRPAPTRRARTGGPKPRRDEGNRGRGAGTGDNRPAGDRNHHRRCHLRAAPVWLTAARGGILYAPYLHSTVEQTEARVVAGGWATVLARYPDPHNPQTRRDVTAVLYVWASPRGMMWPTPIDPSSVAMQSITVRPTGSCTARTIKGPRRRPLDSRHLLPRPENPSNKGATIPTIKQKGAPRSRGAILARRATQATRR